MAVRAGRDDGRDRRSADHGARAAAATAPCPHLVVDPVVAAAQIITALQTIASRNVEPVDAVVVSICSMQTSQVGAFNVVPDCGASWSARCAASGRRPATSPSSGCSEIATKVADALGVLRRDRLHARLPGDRQQRARGAVRRARRRAHVRQGQRDHRADADHGRRGLLVHAAGAPGRLRVPRPGRRPRAAASCTIRTTISTTR